MSFIPAAALLQPRAPVGIPVDVSELKLHNPELANLQTFLQGKPPGACAFDASKLIFHELRHPRRSTITCLKSDYKNQRGKYFIIVYLEGAYIASAPDTDWTCWSRAQQGLLDQLNAYLRGGSRVAGLFERGLRKFWDPKWF